MIPPHLPVPNDASVYLKEKESSFPSGLLSIWNSQNADCWAHIAEGSASKRLKGFNTPPLWGCWCPEKLWALSVKNHTKSRGQNQVRGERVGENKIKPNQTKKKKNKTNQEKEKKMNKKNHQKKKNKNKNQKQNKTKTRTEQWPKPNLGGSILSAQWLQTPQCATHTTFSF